MTISSFCREQLFEHGPLTLDFLTELAVAAGKTRSLQPASSVRSAIARTEVLLADGRWATPLWLLEGRCLTTRRLSLYDDWEPEDLEDLEDDDGLSGRDRHDLALLHHATVGGPVPLATGGMLRRQSYASAWTAPRGWPFARAGRGELLGLRVSDGVLHAEIVRQTPELQRRGVEVAAALGPLDKQRHRSWGGAVARVNENLADALWTRLAADPTFLREPVPPVSECIPALDRALHQERIRQREQRRHWRPHLELPSDLQSIAVEEAHRADQLQDEWLNAFVVRSLRALVRTAEYGEVIPFSRR